VDSDIHHFLRQIHLSDNLSKASVSFMAFFGVTATLAITADGTSIVAAITPAPERVRNYKDLVTGHYRHTSIGMHLTLVSVCTYNMTTATLRTLNLNSKQQQKTALSVQPVSNDSKQIAFLRK